MEGCLNKTLAVVAGVAVALTCVACGSSAPTKTYEQPSPSMMPTLKIGEQVVVSLDSHYTPRVGDIVVFHPPAGADRFSAMCGGANQGTGHYQACDKPTAKESSQTFIKRVVAGPGDTITITDGHVVRNGKRENDSAYTLGCGGGPECTFPTPITIPRGDYFVLGDNRGASDDSRFWGPVPRAWIIGKVIEP